MMIHSVTPVYYLLPQTSKESLTTEPCPYGFIEGTPTPEGLMISRIISTDPAAYLDPAFQPGCLYQPGLPSLKNNY